MKTKQEVIYTKAHFEILDYIASNGGFLVEVAASTVCQNKNFYQRVHKLENEGLVLVLRTEGMASTFSLTDKGERVYKKLKEAKMIQFDIDFNSTKLNKEILIHLISNSNIDERKKELVLDILQ